MPTGTNRPTDNPQRPSPSTESPSSGGGQSSALTRSLEDLPPILTLKQTADLLAVDRRTIYAQINNGKIQAFKIGNAYRIERSSLLTFIRADRPHSTRR